MGWGSVIAVFPERFDGADSSGFYVFEGAVKSGEDFGFWGVVGVKFCELLEGLENEGFEGEVVLGGELGELGFEGLGDLDG